MRTTNTVSELTRLAADLLYQSETDAPWEAFTWADATGVPTPSEVRRRGGHDENAPVAQQSVDAFFAPLIRERDWYGDEEKADATQYRALYDGVKNLLCHATVVQVGTRQQTVYVLGIAPEGGWAGIRTEAVET